MKRSDEFSRIAEIRKRLLDQAPGVRVGPGDDAAVLDSPHASQVLSVDTTVEGVHFKREWASFEDIGYRSAMAALSDLAAMGAEASGALLALTVPTSIDDATLYMLEEGAQQACVQCGCSIVGGNLASGGQLTITTTVVGRLRGHPMQRKGARAGDWIGITGPLGAAALGTHALRMRGGARDADAARFAQAWRRPRARIDAGMALRAVASAAIDISDGLLQDLGHICDASGVGARIEAPRLPRLENHEALAARLAVDPWEVVFHGGDDYELIVACSDPHAFGGWAEPVGRLTGRPGEIEIVDASGGSRLARGHGYRHS